MGLLDVLRGELVDIVEWIDDSSHTLVWRFPRYRNQIKQGAKLIVRPGQTAVFVHQGQLADVFQPGTYELTTGNLPILSTLEGWKYGFDSPFKCEVYFVSTRQITDLKWGTPNPIMLRDSDFGPLRVRAFGIYSLTSHDPAALLRELVGTDGSFETDEVTELMRSIIVSTFAELIGDSKIPVLELAGSYRKISDRLCAEVNERIDNEYGLKVPMLSIVNISLPEEVERALDTRSSIGVLGDMNRYQQYEMGRALGGAAAGDGGMMSDAMGMGVGLAMATRMAQAGGVPGMAPGMLPASGMPVVPAAPMWHVVLNGRTIGPMPQQQVDAMLASGQIMPSVLVWTSGMSDWMPAGQTPAFSSRIGAATPPPLPPGA